MDLLKYQGLDFRSRMEAVGGNGYVPQSLCYHREEIYRQDPRPSSQGRRRRWSDSQAGFLVPELGLSSFLLCCSLFILECFFLQNSPVSSFSLFFNSLLFVPEFFSASLWLFLNSVFSIYVLTIPLARLWTLPVSRALSFPVIW